MTRPIFLPRAVLVSILGSAAFGCGDDASSPGGMSTDPLRDASAFHNPDGHAQTLGDGGPVVLGDGGSGTAPTCGTSPFGASQVEVNLLLVIDKSGSTLETPSGFDTDKWSAIKSSVSAALAAVQDEMSFGLELYPTSGCSLPEGSDIDVAVQPGATAVPAIQDALDAVTPSGGTPTAKALERARLYFTEGAGSTLTGDRYVLLATDGGPNCNSTLSCGAETCTVNLDGQCPSAVTNCCDESMSGAGAQEGCLDDRQTRTEIEALAAAGIDTFVVGIPGTEDYATSLDAFAQAGGQENPAAPPSYFAVDNAGTGATGLTSVLSSITSALVTSCRLQLHADPPEPEKLNVEVEGELVPQPGPDGWELDESTDPPTVELKGATCRRIEEQGVESVTVLFGCPTVVE